MREKLPHRVHADANMEGRVMLREKPSSFVEPLSRNEAGEEVISETEAETEGRTNVPGGKLDKERMCEVVNGSCVCVFARVCMCVCSPGLSGGGLCYCDFLCGKTKLPLQLE